MKDFIKFQKFLFLLKIFFFGACFCEDIKFRIVTLNIWNGGIHGGGREEGLFKFAQHLANLNADIVALQSVVGSKAL
uniref:Candidate secreted effector n=1 Tax=Meloidogyne incognita TaxID=6306 RepID=A0A914LTC6_MELIC